MEVTVVPLGRTYQPRVGDTVYLVITASTRHVFLEHYRPRPYFVLETTIKRIDKQDGRPEEYIPDTGFRVPPDRMHPTLGDAKHHLVSLFNSETDGVLAFEKVHVMSMEEDKKRQENVTAEIHARHTSGTYLTQEPYGRD